jgi:outer membrane protein OmpA-like peptidoglycan-associated protein
MLMKRYLIQSFLLTTIFVAPCYAAEQSVNIDNHSVHIQNGAQELHIDLGKESGGHQNDRDDDAPKSIKTKQSGAVGDFSNADISGQNFNGRDLQGVSFVNATLKNVSFRNANLMNADFSNTELIGCDFRGANVSGADFSNSTFTGSFIKGVDFSRSDLTNADMSGADQTSFIPTSSDSIARSLTRPTEKGKPAFVNLSITFDFDKADISREGYAQIAELAKALQSPSLVSSKLMIEGYTDSKGADDYNYKLSDKRAAAIVAALTNAYGVDASRLQSHGYGETRPVASNDTDFGRAQNRRVTIINLN